MTQPDWQQVRAIFFSAQDVPQAEQIEFVRD